MADHFDIIIVGASVAGLYSGMKLAEAGRRVCIIDRKKKIGIPVRCGEATGNRAELARFIPIDESWIARDLKGLVAHSNGTSQQKIALKDFGVLLHRDRFEQALAGKAREYGAELILETPVSGLIKDHAVYCGVTCDSGREIAGTVIIGADGVESKIGRWAGITEPIPLKDSFSGIQYRMAGEFCNDDYLHFFIGSGIMPNGYIWVFPGSGADISVGAGVYGGNTRVPKVKEVLDSFIAKNIPDAPKNDLITGCVPLSVCPSVLAKDNVVVIGDAARQVNPLTAGGIMNTLEAADLAVQSLLQIHSGNITRSVNSKYSVPWKKTQRRQQKIFYLLKKIFLDFSDKDIDVLLKKVPKFFGKMDRTTTFTFPLFAFLRICILFLPKLPKHFKVFFK